MIELDLTADLLDVRDIIERFETLEAERDYLLEAESEADENLKEGLMSEEDHQKTVSARIQWSDEYGPELADLQKILDDLKGYGGDEQWRGDWYPITLIRESYFTEYARDLLADCDYLPRDLPHWIEIDWEKTAKNMLVDYGEIDICSTTYYYR